MKIKLLLVFFATFLNVVTINCVEKILVNIDRNIREIDEPTSCDVRKWSNKLSNACKCCLVKLIPKLDQGRTAESIVQECIKKGHCTNALIETLKKDSVSLESALRQLYNNSVLVKEIDIGGITFDAQGNFTKEGLAAFLVKAYKEGKLPFEEFKSASCLKIQSLEEEKGLVSAQLFLIDSTCSTKARSYILKEMALKYKETYRLAQFFGLKQVDDLIWPNSVPGLPSLAVPLAFFEYTNHYLSLMPGAPGLALDKFMKNYFLKPNNENKAAAQQAYFDVGYAISKFHQRFMKKSNQILAPTVIHGDFHHKNIFYDPSSKQVVLIDNERMPDSFKKPADILKDLGYLLLASIANDQLIPQEIRQSISKASWLQLITVPFLKGYVQAYPKDARSLVWNKIITGLKNFTFRDKTIYQQYKSTLDKEFKKLSDELSNPE